jgi:hypothetical protein
MYERRLANERSTSAGGVGERERNETSESDASEGTGLRGELGSFSGVKEAIASVWKFRRECGRVDNKGRHDRVSWGQGQPTARGARQLRDVPRLSSQLLQHRENSKQIPHRCVQSSWLASDVLSINGCGWCVEKTGCVGRAVTAGCWLSGRRGAWRSGNDARTS